MIFSSTHDDVELKSKVAAEWEERKNPKSRYSWSFDEAYDIYQTDFQGKNIKISRIAHGIPMGSDIDFIDDRTMGRAMENRVEL